MNFARKNGLERAKRKISQQMSLKMIMMKFSHLRQIATHAHKWERA